MLRSRTKPQFAHRSRVIAAVLAIPFLLGTAGCGSSAQEVQNSTPQDSTPTSTDSPDTDSSNPGATADGDAASPLELRPILPTSASSLASGPGRGGVSVVFWNAMAEQGVTAGMHDGYQSCMHPELGVEVFDIDRFGPLVNPAFDAGYQAGTEAITRGCDELAVDYMATSDDLPDAEHRHRVATVGADFDTDDSHPDFGKGFDAATTMAESFGCDKELLISAAPPELWKTEYPSEFQSGFSAGLNSVARVCETAEK